MATGSASLTAVASIGAAMRKRGDAVPKWASNSKNRAREFRESCLAALSDLQPEYILTSVRKSKHCDELILENVAFTPIVALVEMLESIDSRFLYGNMTPAAMTTFWQRHVH